MMKLPKVTHDKLLKLVLEIQEHQKKFSEFRTKLESIDEAYAKTKVTIDDTDVCTGANSTVSENVAIKVPIVNSEIDSVIAFLSGIFVNRSPLFQVISDEAHPQMAMEFQALISKDARQQGWGRQLLRFISKAVRYNIAAIEVESDTQKDFNLASTGIEGATSLEIEYVPVTRLKALDMYNALFDYRVSPGDIAAKGEYVGYNEIISKVELKALGNRRSEEKIAYNLKEAYSSTMAGTDEYWNTPPNIAEATHLSAEEKTDWFDWAGITESTNLKMAASSYFKTKLYIRIIPHEFGLQIVNPTIPRIIRLEIINNTHIISYKEMVTPLDLLPIFFADTREDGFDYQTKSIGETVTPYQDVATELLHVRLEGSKRALNDRAIYDPDYLDTLDVNSPTAAAKMPLKKALRNAGDRAPMSQIYYQIPFESQGVVNALTDLGTIMELKDQVNGVGMGMRGQHRKGNRTLGEFDAVEGGSEAKGMPYAIRIEEQVMTPLKLFVKYFILSSSKVEQEILDIESQQVVKVNLVELRKAMLEFRLTDGLRPKAALTDPNVLSTALQFVQNSPELNQEYSSGAIFADMMAVLDIDISKHKRQIPNANIPPDTSQNVQPKPANPPDTGGTEQDT
jgi:hypothetical protein